MSTDSDINQVRSKKEMTATAKYVNVAVILVLLGVSAFIIYRVVTDVGIVLFTYHPVLIVLGYLVLFSNAILIMADNNFLTSNLSHHSRVTAHWIVQTFAIILILIAQTCIFVNKNKHGKSHFQTTHSIFGLITVILTMCSALGGVFTKYSYTLRNVVKPIFSKIMHSFGGVLTYVLALITIILGYDQMPGAGNFDTNIIIILLLFAGLYVIIKSVILLFSRIKDVLSR